MCVCVFLLLLFSFNFKQRALIIMILAELWRAKRACGAPWVSKSTHPRKFGNHVTVHRPPVRPHQRATNVHSYFLASLGAQED